MARRYAWTWALASVMAGAACYVGPTDSTAEPNGEGAPASGSVDGSASNGTSTGGAATAGSSTGGASAGNGEGAPAGDLPCAVKALLETSCAGCHSAPLRAPAALVTYEDLKAPALSDPSKSLAEVALARMEDDARPMPPAPGARVADGPRLAFRQWLERGAPREACGGAPADAGSPDAGAGTDAGGPVGPDSGAPTSVCTSGVIWTGRRGPDMQPGRACITCHLANGGDPIVEVGGTVYPTLREPDRCEGVRGGAVVVVTDAKGRTEELAVGPTGNFSLRARNPKLEMPLSVKVIAGGKERRMFGKPSTGDCNSCHTEQGTNGAPGRILFPN
jgi:hypothetical protein